MSPDVTGVASGAAAGGLLAGELGAQRTLEMAGCLELFFALAAGMTLSRAVQVAPPETEQDTQRWTRLVLGALGDPRMRRLILVASGFWALYAQLSVSAPLVTRTTAGTSAMFLANAVVIVALQVPVVRWLDRHGVGLEERVRAGVLLAALSMLILCAPGSVPAALPALGAGIALGEILVTPSLDALAVELAGKASIGTYLGVSALGLGIGGAVGSLVGGALIDLGARLGAAWLTGAALAVAGTFFALVAARRPVTAAGPGRVAPPFPPAPGRR